MTNALKGLRLRRCTRAAGLLTAALACMALADAPKAPAGGAYANDFSKAEPGKLPDDLLVLNGAFTVKEEGGNRFLEVPGTPLDTLGLAFGPAGQTALDVHARIYGTADGKLAPEFGIGANDAGGYKLWLIPAQAAIELRKGDAQVLARAAYPQWQSGVWTAFHLRVAPAKDGTWAIQGKVWPASAGEPEAWTISFDEKEAPIAGQATLWGQPFSETPIGFDDLSAAPLANKP